MKLGQVQTGLSLYPTLVPSPPTPPVIPPGPFVPVDLSSPVKPQAYAIVDSSRNIPLLTPTVPVGNRTFPRGHYLTLDTGSGGGGLSGWLARIPNAATQGYSGVGIILKWNQLEFAKGVYTNGSGAGAGGFALVDQLVNACAAAGLGFWLGYEDRNFFSSTYSGGSAGWTPAMANLPSYFDTLGPGNTKAYVVAPSGTTWGGLGAIAQDDQSYVFDRHIALYQAYAQRYDSNSTVTMIRGPESAVNAGAGLNGANYFTQIKRWAVATRDPILGSQRILPSWSMNFAPSNLSQMRDVYNTFLANGCAGLGPDCSLNNGNFDSCRVWNGSDGGAPFVNLLPCIMEQQQPDVSNAGLTINTANKTYDWAFGTAGVTASSNTRPVFMTWWDGGSSITQAQIIALIADGSRPLNTVVPSGFI